MQGRKMKIDDNKLRVLLCNGDDVACGFEKCDTWVKERFRPVLINGAIRCISVRDIDEIRFGGLVSFNCPKILNNNILYKVSLLSKCKVEDGN